MLTRILTIAACILALMAAVKDGRLLRATGLTASCTVAQRAADGTELDACRAGRLEGKPDLTRRGCTDAGTAGTYEYWRCPAALTSALRP